MSISLARIGEKLVLGHGKPPDDTASQMIQKFPSIIHGARSDSSFNMVRAQSLRPRAPSFAQLSAASVPTSSAPIMERYPAASAARDAAKRRSTRSSATVAAPLRRGFHSMQELHACKSR
jgi:hypothetical protein